MSNGNSRTTLWSIDEFWEIMNFIKDNTDIGSLTDIEQALALAEQAKSERYFSSVIDQVPFVSSADYGRLRNFLRDLYSSHKTIGTTGQQISDPRTIRNSHLDELFRSFGYTNSPQLRGYNETPPELKTNLFLDLVNLYKIKGTPRSIFEALQYYGLDNLDIYEFWVEKSAPGRLIARGDKVVGTTSTTSLIVPVNFLTIDDPHWFQTESQILTLDAANKISLPSKTPYIGVQPIGEVSSDVAIVSRFVADQYESWNTSGTLPTQNAEVSEFGITVSLLELYMACIYQFNAIYTDAGIVGVAGDRYFCYDGTSTNVITITNEYETLIGTAPQTRAQILTLIDRLHDQFYRLKPRNFLQTASDAGTLLNTLNSSFKAQIDAETDAEELLASLLKDLANWVRINVGLGFVTYSLVVGGASSVLSDLLDVINFFKPYRARTVLLEGVQYNNRALNTIVVEDSFEEPLNLMEFRDYVTGDGDACCSNPEDDDAGCGGWYTETIRYSGADSPYDRGALVEVPTDDALNIGTGDFSISLWAKTTDAPKDVANTYYPTFLMKDDPYAAVRHGYQFMYFYFYFAGDYYGPFVSFTVNDTGMTTACQEIVSDFVDGEFHHVVVTKDSSNLKLYVDNVLVKTTPHTLGDISNTSHLYIGGYNGTFNPTNPYPGSEPWADFGGTLDNIRIFKDHALTPSEISQIYNTQDTAAAMALFLDFRGDFRDSSGNDRHGSQITAPQEESGGQFVQGVDGQYYQRTTYDCGSFYDIGAVVDGGITDVLFEETLEEHLKCGRDGSAEVSFIRNDYDYVQTDSMDLFEGSSEFEAFFTVDQTDSNYIVLLHLENLTDIAPSQYDVILTNKQSWGFEALFSDNMNSDNYRMFWKVHTNANSGSQALSVGDYTKTITLPIAQPSSSYRVGYVLRNETDANPSHYSITVIDKTPTTFTVQFSDLLDSNNYVLDWALLDDVNQGSAAMSTSSLDLTVSIPTPFKGTNYSLALSVVDVWDMTAANYIVTVVGKTQNSFTVRFSDIADTSNYILEWSAEEHSFELNFLDYTQYGEWRSYDGGNSHDCTHGFDECNIYMERVRIGPFLLLETDALLLLEDDGGILLE